MKILENRNVYIVYPRNFGTSDHSSEFTWSDMAGKVFFIQTTLLDLCMSIKFLWPLLEDTAWEAKLPWMQLAII